MALAQVAQLFLLQPTLCAVPLGFAEHPRPGFLRETAHTTLFAERTTRTGVFELAFSMNSHDDFELSRRSP